MKLTLGTLSTPRIHRRVVKGAAASKRAAIAQQPRILPAPRELDRPVDPCDNSNDSGLGFDHPQEFTLRTRNVKFSNQEWLLDHSEAKRKKLDIKFECDDVNDNFCFPEAMNSKRRAMPDSAGVLQSESGMYCPLAMRPESTAPRPQDRLPGRGAALGATVSRRLASGGSPTLTSHFGHTSRNRKVYLQIVSQPEQQHRARYQTEGSRGAVKDRSGNGFPVIKLVGYDKPATLQVFIGTDIGRVAPHMFYQACRVSGKNSTPCLEKKVDGTVVIEVNFDPAKEMVITCDCVGILKERNVDVEHRFPEHSTSRNKKKSTRCRMVFRTTITHPDGSNEVLQILSQPIACTQPPGVPEVCKRSLTSCVCAGGAELFILGKNFLKDTVVMFDQPDTEPPWRETVQPDKEFLQQTHLVCVVPPYRSCDITEPVSVRLMVMSSGKTSEPHTFLYTPGGPVKQPVMMPERLQPCGTVHSTRIVAPGMEMSHLYSKPSLGPMCMSDARAKPSTSSVGAGNLPSSYVPLETSQGGMEKEAVHSHIMWQSAPIDVTKLEDRNAKDRDVKRLHMMKPTPPPLLPLVSQRLAMVESEVIRLKTEVPDGHYSPGELKVIDLRMKPPTVVQPLLAVADLSTSEAPSMVTVQHFVEENNGSSLPAQSAQSVEKFLLRLENKQTNMAQEEEKHGFPMVSVQDARITVKQEECGPAPVSLLSDDFQQRTTLTQPTLLTTLMSPTMPVIFPSETSSTGGLTVEQAEKKMMLDMKTEVSNMLEASLINSSVNSDSGNLSIGTCHISQTPLIPASHTNSLDVLVSSAISPHVRAQTTSTEKLDAFVNSTVDSHLMNAVPVNSGTTLHGQSFASSSAGDGQTLSLNMLNMGPSVPSSSVGNFQLTGLESNPRTSQAELLPSVVSSALDEHLLATTKSIITDSSQVTSVSSAGDSNMNHVLLRSASHPSDTLLSHAVAVGEPTIISSEPRTSPIALKNMILNTAAASLEAGPTCSTRTSPIAIKAMILDSHMKAMDSQMIMAAGTSGVLEDSGAISTLLSNDAKSAVSQVPALPQTTSAIQSGDSTSQSILDNIFGTATTAQSYAASSNSISTFVSQDVTRITQASGPLVVSATENKLETSATTIASSLSQQNACVSSVAVPVVSIPTKCLPAAGSSSKKSEEGEVPQELTQMSENDLLSYINPSCFDQVYPLVE